MIYSNNETQSEFSLLITDVFKELEVSKIRYCVLRNYEQLPDETNNDVDLLIQDGKIHQYVDLINRVAQERDWHILRFNFRWGFCKVFLYKDISTEHSMRRVAEIDCWWISNHWRGIPRISSSAVLKTRRWERCFWVTSYGAEAAIPGAQLPA